MKSFPSLLLAAALLLGLPLAAKEEVVISSDLRRISVDLSEGFTFASTENAGVVSVEIGDAKRTLSLHMDFVPDPNARLGTEDSQKTMLAETSQSEAEQSVEKGYDFQALEPKTGNGLYVVFTDASLVGKPPPPGEFLKLTRGIKSWSGFAVIFSLVSQDNTSDEYKAVLKMLKTSVEEKKPAGPSI
jgi:hypothetical protein